MNNLHTYSSLKRFASHLFFGWQSARHKSINARIRNGLIGNKLGIGIAGLCVQIINSCNQHKQQSGPNAESATAGFWRHSKAVASSQTISFRFLTKCHSVLPQNSTMTNQNSDTTKFVPWGETSFHKNYNLGKKHPENIQEKRRACYA